MADHGLTDRDRALLVALADGRLRGRRRAHAEERLARVPGGHELLDRQRRVSARLRGGPALTASAAIPLPEPARPSRLLRPAFRLGLAAATVAAVAAAALAVLLPSGGHASAADVAALDHLSATQPAPKPLQGSHARLDASFEGVSYPDWG